MIPKSGYRFSDKIMRDSGMAAAKLLCDKFAAVAQAFLVDAVADAGRNVPFRRHLQRGQPLRGMEYRLHRDELILVAVNQQHRRPAADLAGECVGIDASGTTSMPE